MECTLAGGFTQSAFHLLYSTILFRELFTLNSVWKSYLHLIAVNMHYTKFTLWTPKLQILAKTLSSNELDMF